MERALLLGSLMLVLIIEVLNASIEAAVDHTSTEHHTLAGRGAPRIWGQARYCWHSSTQH